MTDGGGAYQQIEVAYQRPAGPQPPALLCEYPAHREVNRQYVDIGKEVQQCAFVGLRIVSPQDSLIQFGERHDARADALRPQFVETLRYCLDAVQIVDDPVRVHQELQLRQLLTVPRAGYTRLMEHALQPFSGVWSSPRTSGRLGTPPSLLPGFSLPGVERYEHLCALFKVEAFQWLEHTF